MDLSVCERWTLHYSELRDGGAGRFLEWIRRDPDQVSRHLTAGFLAYGAVQSMYGPGGMTAREYFGGFGAQSLMIADLLEPRAHTVIDRSAGAAAWLQDGLRHRDILVQQADSYEPGSYAPADLVGLDFGDLTAWRLRPGQPQRELLDRVFSGSPKAVVITDVAGPRLHLHRERYGKVLHRRPQSLTSYPTYLYALDDWFRAHYDYRMVRGYWHRWSAVLALVPTSVSPGEGPLLPVPAEPVGLEVL